MKEARLDAGLTQVRVAEAIGIDRSQVIKHEKGDSAMRPATMRRYQLFFKLPDNYFQVLLPDQGTDLVGQVGVLAETVANLTRAADELAGRVEELERRQQLRPAGRGAR